MFQKNFDDLANEKQNFKIPFTSLDLRALWCTHVVSEANAYAKVYDTSLKKQFSFSSTTYPRCNTKHIFYSTRRP